MGILHCAAQNNHVGVMNFIFESLENMNINEGEMVSFISFISFIDKERLMPPFEVKKCILLTKLYLEYYII